MRSIRLPSHASNGMRASALLGTRLRTLREQNGFSQGDMEKRTGLLRCYISSVEHSHTVPSVDTLEKIARALNVPLASFFDKMSKTKTRKLQRVEGVNHHAERGHEEDRRFLRLLHRHVRHLDDQYRVLLLFMARTMSRIASEKKARNGR